MMDHQLPKYPSAIDKHSHKYILLTIGIIKSFTNNSIYLPLCLIQYIFQYGLYFSPVNDSIKLLPLMVNYSDSTKPCDDDINKLIIDICDAILPFTRHIQIKYQLSFDVIQQCTKYNVITAFIHIINYSCNTELIENTMWLMTEIDNANDKKISVWSNIVYSIDFSRIFAYVNRNFFNIHYSIWNLLATMTKHCKHATMIPLKNINIYFLMMQELNKLNDRSCELFKYVHLAIIEKITQTFNNFLIYDINEADNQIDIFTHIIEIILIKIVSINNFINESYQREENLYIILNYYKMQNIIDKTLYNVIKALSYLITYGCHDIIYTVFNNTQILTNDTIIHTYIELLNDYNPTIREYIQEILIKISEHRPNSITLLQQYIELGLADQMNLILSESTCRTYIGNKEIKNYLIIFQNILSQPHDFISSLILHSGNDAMILWLLLVLDAYDDMIAYQNIMLIVYHQNDNIFKKIIKFDDGYIFRILNQRLTEYKLIDNCWETNCKIYTILLLLSLIISKVKIIKHKNGDNDDTQLMTFICNNIDIINIRLFIEQSYPSLCKIINLSK